MATSITVRVPLTIRRRPGRKTVVTPVRECGTATMPTRANPALVKALARAFRYQRLLDEGQYASISEMAVAEKIERGYLGRLLRLTLLAPGLIEAMLDGCWPKDLALPQLLEPFPIRWDEQCASVRTAIRDGRSRFVIDRVFVTEQLPVPRIRSCGDKRAFLSSQRPCS